MHFRDRKINRTPHFNIRLMANHRVLLLHPNGALSIHMDQNIIAAIAFPPRLDSLSLLLNVISLINVPSKL